MKTDIKLAGVGGQGILSIATVIGEAATNAGLYLKQAEVHGMSQRGGDVQSDLRLSTDPIHSDLIPQGGADLILSMEPMEALRYLPYLAPEGTVVTSSRPFVNIPDYPSEIALQEELDALPRMTKMDIDAVAKELMAPGAQTWSFSEWRPAISPSFRRTTSGRPSARYSAARERKSWKTT